MESRGLLIAWLLLLGVPIVTVALLAVARLGTGWIWVVALPLAVLQPVTFGIHLFMALSGRDLAAKLGARRTWRVAAALTCGAPLVNILAAPAFVCVARARLGSAGIPVRLLGPSRREVQSLRQSRCSYCGYEVEGLRPGVCPEYGSVVRPEMETT